MMGSKRKRRGRLSCDVGDGLKHWLTQAAKQAGRTLTKQLIVVMAHGKRTMAEKNTTV